MKKLIAILIVLLGFMAVAAWADECDIKDPEPKSGKKPAKNKPPMSQKCFDKVVDFCLKERPTFDEMYDRLFERDPKYKLNEFEEEKFGSCEYLVKPPLFASSPEYLKAYPTPFHLAAEIRKDLMTKKKPK